VKLRAEDLTFSIKLFDFGLGISKIGPIVDLSMTAIGKLMIAAGFQTSGDGLRGPRGFRGPIDEVTARIKLLTQQKATALRALEDALITDDERIKREAEHQTFREALRTMTIQGSSDGRSLVAFTKDGDPLPRSSMTTLQQKAFDWNEAAHWGR
jgi:hypothetical protein